MPRMSIGGHTLTKNPKDTDPGIINKRKRDAVSENVGGGDYYTWGLTYVGKEIALVWDHMLSTEYDTLLGIYEQDQEVVWDPQDGTGRTFNVVIRDFDGRYLIGLEANATTYRKDVRMLLNIRSEVV